MILLDTNVLVYATTEGPFAEIASDLVAMSNDVELRITPRTLEEFGHVFARHNRSRNVALDMTVAFSEALGPVVDLAEEDLSDAFDLWPRHPALDLADALLAATARRLDATLVSADKAFADVPGLKFFDLADPDLLDRLQAQ